MSKRSGLFVTFEGGDGAGKTTLMDRIAMALQMDGRAFIRTREPGGTPLGDEIRKMLLNAAGTITPRAELCLFLAARAQHIQETILPALQAGKVVLCDRFNDSTIAYQGLGRGLGLDYVQSACQLLCGDVQPNLTFFLDLDPQVGIERAKRSHDGKLDRIESERLAFHNAVRHGFLELARRAPERICVVDASHTPDQVYTAVYQKLQAQL